MAQAVTDTIFKYTTAKTGYYSISHMAMAPDSAGSANFYGIGWMDYAYVTAHGCLQTGVNLPNGVTMTALTVWYSSGTSGNPKIELLRTELHDGSTDTIVDKTFADDSQTRKLGVVAIRGAKIAVVDNGRFTYGIGVCLDPVDRFYGARITYTYDNAGD